MNTKEALALYKEAKEIAQNLDQATSDELEIVRKVIPNMSPVSFMMTKSQMKSLGWAGIPGLDTKTLNGWKQFGYRVNKGEKSLIKGITFMEFESKENKEDKFVAPRMYHLFHISQVTEMKQKEETGDAQ